jgi:hypothetical protein
LGVRCRHEEHWDYRNNKTIMEQSLQYIHCSTVQYSTVQYSTVQYSTVQYSTVQYSTIFRYYCTELNVGV